MDTQQNISSWDKYSPEYYQHSTFDKEIIHLGLGIRGLAASRIVLPHMRVLDVGCGDGTNTNIMAQQTDGNVIGIDVATSAVCEAQTKYKKPNLSFLCADLAAYCSMTRESKFDLITFFGSLDYLPLDEDFFGPLNLLTHIGTTCVISKFHPFWTTLFGNDVEDARKLSYFDDGRSDKVCFGAQQHYEFSRIHYSLDCLLGKFSSFGWRLKHLEEPKPDFRNSAFRYNGYDTDPILVSRLSRIPMTLVLIFERC